MNYKQIKKEREFHENSIDRYMSEGYGGADDTRFKMACKYCSFHEEELKKLSAASQQIKVKTMQTKMKKKGG